MDQEDFKIQVNKAIKNATEAKIKSEETSILVKQELAKK